MRLYHRTTAAAAAAILGSGFVDHEGYYGLVDDAGEPVQLCGAWVSDVPLDANEGAKGDTLLAVDLHVPLLSLADSELVEEGKPYRERCIPAAVLNQAASVAIVADEFE